jgi:hypothetical protein
VGVIVGGRTPHFTLVSSPSLETQSINFPREQVDFYPNKCHVSLELIEKTRNRIALDENKEKASKY